MSTVTLKHTISIFTFLVFLFLAFGSGEGSSSGSSYTPTKDRYNEGYSKGEQEGYTKAKQELEDKMFTKNVPQIIIIAIHIFMVISILLLVFLIIMLVIDEKGATEKIIRGGAIILAFLLYYLSLSTGLSIPILIVDSIREGQEGMKSIFGVLALTGIFGAISAYITDKVSESHSILVKRILIIFTTWLLLLFGETYTYSLGEDSDNDVLLVNASFIAGVFIYMLFFVEEPIKKIGDSVEKTMINLKKDK